MTLVGPIWSSLSSDVQAALITGAFTLIVAIAGFGGLIIQMRSQARQGRDAVAENERRKLKAEMYEQAVLVSRQLSDSAIGFSTQLRTMSLELRIASEAHMVGLGYPTPVTRFRTLLTLYSSFSDAALRFIFLIENRQIIDPRLIVFRSAMNSVLHDAGNLAHREFPVHVMPTLPLESPAGPLFPYTPPSPESAENVATLSKRLIDSLDDAVAYTEDFLVEMQNCLLGDLFGTTVHHRVPLDPNAKVITLDDAPELEEWFQTSTDWGKKNSQVEAEVSARFEDSAKL